uniref:Uncharacterized protein n=1 Tax=Fagus sylvatica TaxID=28930 RepID=A0A2N9HE00_FAGSY
MGCRGFAVVWVAVCRGMGCRGLPWVCRGMGCRGLPLPWVCRGMGCRGFAVVWVAVGLEHRTKFFVVCEPGIQHMEALLKIIYVLKNPFYEMEMSIRCELFEINLT